MISSEDKYWIWLCSLPEIHRKEQGVLLEYFGSPEAVFHAKDSDFEPWIRLRRQWIRTVMRNRTQESMEIAVRRIEEGEVHFVRYTDDEYPKKLLEIGDYPYGLFYRGSLPPQNVPAAAVIGARNCSPYGQAMARQIANVVTSLGMPLISGMACGIDGIAQRQAIRNGGRVYAVLGSGADVCYPPENADLYDTLRKSGGIISELGCYAKPLKHHFPMRNRIISGLSDVVIVVEARSRSGTLITVDLANDQGRDILTVPGRTDDELSAGCNHLIAQGAGIIESEEALEELLLDRFPRLMKTKRAQISLAPEEKLVYSYLDLMPRGIDELSRATGLAPEKLMVICMDLQLKQVAAETGRNKFVRKQ